jgi:hypothetical protein
MGFLKSARAGGIVFVLLALTGCQVNSTISTARLIHHQQVIDTTGLRDTEVVEAVKARAAAPQRWDALAIKKTALFTDMQWRSPSKMTGVGVAYIRMPLPVPAAALIWFAKQEYCKRADDGKLIGEWTDGIGRPWFEAENNKYHVRGYVVTKGFEAWIVYCGYRTETPPSQDELRMAQRSAETIIPTPLAPSDARTPTAIAN